MARSHFRRAPRLENLESRELLSTAAPGGGPTNQEQYMLQVLNLVRTNPQAAVQYLQQHINSDTTATLNYYGVNLQQTLQQIGSMAAQPPLAWNSQLAQSAQSHSQDMATNGFQAHTGSNGSTPPQRIQQAGYTDSARSGENVYAYADSVDHAMEAFLLDWGVSDAGHRANILQPGTAPQDSYRDVGIGIVNNGTSSPAGPMVVTQDFGNQDGELAQVVGVVYNDAQHNGMYEPGEGDGTVTITAVNLANGQTSSTQTWDSGGYALPLNPGRYKIIAGQDGQVIGSQTVVVNDVNIEVDFNTTGTSQGGSLSAAISSAQGQTPAPKSAPVVAIPTASRPVTTPVVSAIDWNWAVSTAKKANV